MVKHMSLYKKRNILCQFRHTKKMIAKVHGLFDWLSAIEKLTFILIESDDLDAINKKPGRKPMADEDALSDVSISSSPPKYS